MRKLKILIQFILFVSLILICSKVNAASITLAPNKSSVTEGDEFTISMNLSDASLASLNVKITVDTSKVEYISSSAPNNTNFNNGKILYTWTDTSGGENPKKDGTIVTFRLRAKSEGTANFNISGKFYDVDENSINMTLNNTSVKINKQIVVAPPIDNTDEPQDNNENNGETTEPPEDNNEQPPSEDNNEQQPSDEENNQPPQEDNNPEEPEEDNNQQDNNQDTNNNLSSNAYLSNLQVDVEGISPRFNKNTTKYYLIIDNSIDTINVNATPEDSNAKVTVTGNTNLQIGNNTVTIIVTAQDGSTRNYTISVSKTNDPNNANTNLENLAIENVTLNPEFSADVLEYSANVGSNIDSLNILAVPEIEEANVKVTGGDKLSFGNNIITITVTSKDGQSIKIYNVNVYRKTEVEEIEEQNRLLEEKNNIIENYENNEILNDGLNNVKTRNNNTALWVIFFILLFIVIGIVIYLIWKKKNNKYN